jgi:coatomer subunit beta
MHNLEPANKEDSGEYRRLLIRHLHGCVARFPEEAPAVVNILVYMLSDSDAATATDVVMFLRELICTPGVGKDQILEKLHDVLTDVTHSRVVRGCLWLLGEFATEPDMIANVAETIVNAMEPLPLRAEKAADKPAEGEGDGKKDAPAPAKVTTRTIVLADGTYGTEEVSEQTGGEEVQEANKKTSPWRDSIIAGDFLLGTVAAFSVTKLLLKLKGDVGPKLMNRTLLFIASLIQFVKSHQMGGEVSDSVPRLLSCVKALTGDTATWAAGEEEAKLRLKDVMVRKPRSSRCPTTSRRRT